MSTGFINICKIKKRILDCKIKRVLEINKHLQDKDKIRIISISMGFQDNMKGYNEIYNAIEEAKKSNVFVRKTC